MSRASKKLERLSLQQTQSLFDSACRITGNSGLGDWYADMPDLSRATRLVVAADHAFDLLAWTNDNIAKQFGRTRAKSEFKAIADAHRDQQRITALWTFIAHALVTARRDDAPAPDARREEHQYLAMLNREFPLPDDSQAFLEASRHPDPWVRALDSFAMSIAFDSFAVLFEDPEKARSLSMFDEGDGTGWGLSYLLSAQWLGTAKQIHLERTLVVAL